MSGNENKSSNSDRSRPAVFLSRLRRNCLHAIDGERKFGFVGSASGTDRETYGPKYTRVGTWFSYQITAIALSAIGTGIGIGTGILKIRGLL